MSEDDLEPLVTTCPNCGTRFKVTESQLQVADVLAALKPVLEKVLVVDFVAQP